MADEEKTVENPSLTGTAKKTADSKKKGAAKKAKSGKAAKKAAAGKAPASVPKAPKAPKAPEAQTAPPPTGAPAGLGDTPSSSQSASPEPAVMRPSVGREGDTESVRSGMLALWGPATMLIFVVLIFRFMGDDESNLRGVAGDPARAVLMSAEPESGTADSQRASPETAVEKAVAAVAAEQVQGGALGSAGATVPAAGESAGAGSLTRGQAAAPASPDMLPEISGSQADSVAEALQSATSEEIMAATAAAQSPEGTAYAPAPHTPQNPWAPSGAGAWGPSAAAPPPPTGQQTWAAAPPAYPPQGVYPQQSYPQYGWQPIPPPGYGVPSPYQRPAYPAAPPAGAYPQAPPGAYPQPYYGPQQATPYGPGPGYPPPGY